jgi:hypothetical protein
MTTTPKPLSAADIHNTYSMGIRDAASNKPVTGEYKRTSHNGREPGHPGSPPPRLPVEKGKKRR